VKKLIEMLRRHEGVETHAYKCSGTPPKITVGVGRNIDPAGGLGLSTDEIDYLLANDIARCVKELEGFPWFPGLVGARRDAMIDICFNLGISRLKLFKLALAAMGNQQYDEAADQFLLSRWAKQVGNRAIELAEMIRTSEYQKTINTH